MGWSYSIEKVTGWELDYDVVEDLVDSQFIASEILDSGHENLSEYGIGYSKDNTLDDRAMDLLCDGIYLRFILHEGIYHEIWYLSSEYNPNPCIAVLPFKKKENQSLLLKLLGITTKPEKLEYICIG